VEHRYAEENLDLAQLLATSSILAALATRSRTVFPPLDVRRVVLADLNHSLERVGRPQDPHERRRNLEQITESISLSPSAGLREHPWVVLLPAPGEPSEPLARSASSKR